MSLRCSPRLGLILAVLALLPAGCGQEEVKVKEVPASEVVLPKKDRLPSEITPRKGSSAGMNYNPGGPPPNVNVE